MKRPDYAKNIASARYEELKEYWEQGTSKDIRTPEEAAVYLMIAIEEPDKEKTYQAFFGNDEDTISALDSLIKHKPSLCVQGMEKAICDYYDVEKHGIHGLDVFSDASYLCNYYNTEKYDHGLDSNTPYHGSDIQWTLRTFDGILSILDHLPEEEWEKPIQEDSDGIIKDPIYDVLNYTSKYLKYYDDENPLYDRVKKHLFEHVEALFSPSFPETKSVLFGLFNIYNRASNDEIENKKELLRNMLECFDPKDQKSAKKYFPKIIDIITTESHEPA